MLQTEDLLTLTELAKRVPGRPHSSTLWRWARRGVKSRCGGRVRLEHMRAGARVLSSWDAFCRFAEALAEADAAHFSQPDDRPIAEPEAVPA